MYSFENQMQDFKIIVYRCRIEKKETQTNKVAKGKRTNRRYKQYQITWNMSSKMSACCKNSPGGFIYLKIFQSIDVFKFLL